MIQSEIDRLTRTLSISLGIGLLVLYAVLLPLMIGITRTLRRQNHRLQEQADQLSDLLEREQDTVAELRELDRMKSDFVAATSHELRTPLTSIRGYVHILRESALAGDPVAVEALAAIERQSSRLFRLIGNVLRESNLEHDDASNAVFMFAFADLVDEVVADFHDAGRRIVREIPNDLPAVTVDRRRVQDVLVNLVDNALKYSTAPTPVTIGARVDETALDVLGARRRDRHRSRRPPADLRTLLSGGPVRDALLRRRRARTPHRRGPAGIDRRNRRRPERAGDGNHVHGDRAPRPRGGPADGRPTHVVSA